MFALSITLSFRMFALFENALFKNGAKEFSQKEFSDQYKMNMLKFYLLH